jgi:diguanylate cyclase (GGDEF)-like protein
VDRLKLTSPGLLLIIAVVASCGIFLLDVFYLRPHTQQQERAMVVDEAQKAEKSVRLVISSNEELLGQSTNAWLRNEHMRQYLTDGLGFQSVQQSAQDVLASSGADIAWLAGPAGQIVAAWKMAPNNVVSTIAAADLPQLADVNSAIAPDGMRTDISGLIKLPDSLAVLSGRPVWLDAQHTQVLGYVYLGRYINNAALQQMGESVDGLVAYADSASLPPGEIDTQNARLSIWYAGGDKLSVAFLATDLTGKPAGYFRAKFPISQIQRQVAGGRRTVLIVLSLSMGLSLLVIVGAHMLITGPVVRLLKRLQRLESGEGSAKDLARDLHGEPLLLARRLESAFDRLAYMSKTDQLTGLANRRHFEQVLSCFYNQARRYNRTLSLVMIDVDFFKAINDTGGHQAGDEVLKSVAGAIEKACRMADLPSRFGGDEFAVLLPETAAGDAQAVAGRIAAAVAGLKIRVKQMNVSITISVGIADLNSGEMDSPEAMMALADRALYAAKELGRNRIIQAHDLTGMNWKQCGEASNKVDVMCKKLAGLDNQFKDLFLRAIEEMVAVMEHRSPHMADHAYKVQYYAILIAKEMELSQRVIKRIQIASMLHDIGMIAIPDAVLLNPNKLDEQQLQIIRRHPLLSVRIMEGMEFLEQEIPAVRYHHERYDGKGYPEGISGPDIPLTARILTVADAFDAMTSARTFRKAMTCEDALKELQQESGKQFDPDVVKAFLAASAKLGDKLMNIPARRKSSTHETKTGQTVTNASQHNAAGGDAGLDVVDAIVNAGKAELISPAVFAPKSPASTRPEKSD